MDTDLASMGHPLAAHAAGGAANNTSLGNNGRSLATSRLQPGNARHETISNRRLEDSAPRSCPAAAAFAERECFFRAGIRARDTSTE